MNEYEILGITQLSTKAEVKRAYKKLAQQHHPDKSHDNGEKFKQIKAAYDLIIKQWTVKPRVKKPQPPPVKPASTFWTSTTDRYAAPKSDHWHQVEVDFSDLFGAKARIPNTAFYVDVPYGVVEGHRQQVFAHTLGKQNVECFNVEYHLVDPTGFYSQRVINGVNCLYCKVNVTTGMVLGEYEIPIRNIHPNLEGLRLKVSTKPLQCIPHYGLPGTRGSRGNLYVEQVIEIKTLDQEIYPVLQQLQQKLREVLEGRTYNQCIK